MRQSLDVDDFAQPPHLLEIGEMGREQRVQHRLLGPRHRLRQGPAWDHAASQAVAIGVQAGRGQGEQRVTFPDRRAVDDRVAFTHPDHEAGDVVGGGLIEPWHFRRLTAEQRATHLAAGTCHPSDDVRDDRGFEDAGGHVIEEEEGLRARREHVVDTVVDQVGADLRVTARPTRQQDLGADPVGARHQDRFAVAVRVEREQPAEGTNARQHLRAPGRFRQRLDQLDHPAARVDVDARIAIRRHRGTVSSASLSISSCTGTGTG